MVVLKLKKINMKYVLTSAIFFCIMLSSHGQEIEKSNTLTFKIGPGYIARQDLIFSPFIHTDFSLINIGLEYTRQSSLFQQFSLRFGSFSPMVTDPYDYSEFGEKKTAYPHSFNLVDFDYLIGTLIKKSQNSGLTAGGMFSTDIQALNYVSGRISSFGYYSAIGLGVFGRNRFDINEKGWLTATLKIPIAVWLARSPYLVNDDEFIENISSHSDLKTFKEFIADGRLATWNRVQMFDVEIKYTHVLNDKWHLGAAYQFDFIHSGRPRNLLSYRSSVNFSANFNF
jgi:hypothetical protein